ncbi:hypothetical protein F5Y08DRAFT_303653 [Xylaria arbuscula]|nr:hypothetical protein F5Y08DRAFT_303653 [Xylaria arbuscula]
MLLLSDKPIISLRLTLEVVFSWLCTVLWETLARAGVVVSVMYYETERILPLNTRAKCVAYEMIYSSSNKTKKKKKKIK